MLLLLGLLPLRRRRRRLLLLLLVALAALWLVWLRRRVLRALWLFVAPEGGRSPPATPLRRGLMGPRHGHATRACSAVRSAATHLRRAVAAHVRQNLHRGAGHHDVIIVLVVRLRLVCYNWRARHLFHSIAFFRRPWHDRF
jgi:hypothetical protein